MSDKIVFDLQKKLDFKLEKEGIDKGIITRVGFCLDTSGSMLEDYQSGRMSRLTEALLPVAMRFDDNGSMEVYAFSTRAHHLPDMNIDNYKSYIDRNVLKNWSDLSGLTNYAEGLSAFISEWNGTKFGGIVEGMKSLFGFGKAKEASEEAAPGFIILQTDGCNHDDDETREIIEKLQQNNIFVCFVGTGGSSVSARLRKYADSSENVSLINIDDLSSFSEDTLYDELVSPKFVKWIKAIG